MKKKKFEDLTQIEQDVIKAYRYHGFISELEKLNWDELDDDMYMKIMIFILLATNDGASWIDSDNNEHYVLNGEFIIRKYKENKKLTIIENITQPSYIYERKEYQKEVIVDGHKGFVTDWEEYINGKAYYEYSEDSYERQNWRTLSYEWKEYLKMLNK